MDCTRTGFEEIVEIAREIFNIMSLLERRGVKFVDNGRDDTSVIYANVEKDFDKIVLRLGEQSEATHLKNLLAVAVSLKEHIIDPKFPNLETALAQTIMRIKIGVVVESMDRICDLHELRSCDDPNLVIIHGIRNQIPFMRGNSNHLAQIVKVRSSQLYNIVIPYLKESSSHKAMLNFLLSATERIS